MTSPLRAHEPARASHPRPYLRVAPEPYRRRRTAAAVSLAVVLVFGSLLASAVFHSVLVRGQLHLDDTQRRTEQLRLQVARDRVRLAELQSPPHLAAAAERQGMVPATEVFAVGSGPDAPVATGSAPGDPNAHSSNTADPPAEQNDNPSDGQNRSPESKRTTTTTAPARSSSSATPSGGERAARAPSKGPLR